MKVFIMAIFIGYFDPVGGVFYSPFEEYPQKVYHTEQECLTASKIKGDKMYESSIKYPDLGIVHIKIDCVETSDKAGTI